MTCRRYSTAQASLQSVQVINKDCPDETLPLGSRHGGVTAALKNTIDWATRGDGNPFHEKPILVMGTSPGAWGAIKSSLVLRQTLVHIQAHVLPNQVQVPLAEKNIGADGALLDPAHVKMCHTACRALLKYIQTHRP